MKIPQLIRVFPAYHKCILLVLQVFFAWQKQTVTGFTLEKQSFG